MFDFLGCELHLGDVITYNIDWEGIDVGIVRNITNSGVTFVNLHNDLLFLENSLDCVIIDQRYQGMRFENVQDKLAEIRPPAFPDPCDVMHRPIDINDIVTFGRTMQGSRMTLGRVTEIWDFESPTFERSRLRVEVLRDGPHQPLTLNGNQVAVVDTSFAGLATPLLKDLFTAFMK